MTICVLTVLLVLMCIAFSLLSRSYPEDEKDIYKARLVEAKQAQENCSTLINRNETNINWLKAMHGAFRLDKINAAHQLDLAEASATKEDFFRANYHLQKAIDWYNAYHNRLRKIYGLDKGEIPPIPVIK